ncbi:hybrid sensor histidine kinase/response regulator [Acidovorax sp. LjRoot118]|uniref:hybrid sensor histidine kinase/response regulator n=1 Tax=unclassified Acidovorax TaxID=2684926 RepID=UPI00070F6162|nr:hybrid sensor histidine kinase/response regulator [Acidovorax sp. Root219]KRC21083.1 two-component system sensor histidine kinase/response regulator [Acidovorax sp. Root219]
MSPTLLHPPPPPAERIKCLVVDDVPENLVAVEALLHSDSIEVLKAQSGPEALELLLLHGDVALALLDVQMPEMNGFELAELIRGSERTRHIPLIFMTAGSRDPNWQFRGYETGAVDFLYKPIDPQMLASKAGVFFELFRQKRSLARELRERTEALRINEMFMAVLSHDLRTPLMAIGAAATALQRQPLAADRAQALAGRVLSSSQRMARMIEDLLDVTRIRQGTGLAMRMAPVDLHAVLQRSLQEIRTSFPNHVISTSDQGNLAGMGDEERLCQLAINLIGNAVHHGDPAVAIHVALDGTDTDTVALTVTNGGTIPPALLPQLFSPFRGRDQEPGRHQGLGLGLFIVQQIVRSHGGRIDVQSEDGTTRFHVVLPRCGAAAAG